MFLAASPAGAEPSPAPTGFSRADACTVVGLTCADFDQWERALSAEAGVQLTPTLAFADLLALAILRAVIERLGWRAGAFTLGVGQLFQGLGTRPDLERLDDYAALVGRDFARLAELRSDHVRCSGDEFVVVPLGPILARLRDQVFP